MTDKIGRNLQFSDWWDDCAIVRCGEEMRREGPVRGDCCVRETRQDSKADGMRFRCAFSCGARGAIDLFFRLCLERRRDNWDGGERGRGRGHW